MSKSAINTTLTITANFSSVSSIYGAVGALLFKGQMVLPSTNNVSGVTIESSSASGDDVVAAPGTYQDYSAVDLSTIMVKGTAGDKITLVGEGVEENWGGRNYT